MDKKTEVKNNFKKRIYSLTLKLIKLIENLPKDRASNKIADQLIRSGTSIIANYVEGQSASSKKELANFFSYSLKSANESKLWLAILRDSGKIKEKEAEYFLKEINELAKIFASSIITLRKAKK